MTATAPSPLPVRACRPMEDPAVGDLSTADLVRAARGHDHGAWEELVGRYGGMVRGVAASYRLSESDVADVAQNTWLRAFERLDTLREPDRLGGWLATIARRECLAILRRTVREVTDGLLDDDVRSTAPGPEATVLAVEARGMVRRAVAELPVRRRALIGTLFGEAEVGYADVSRVLDIPPGSIGPTRGRVLRMLRQALEQDGLTEGSVA
jgi:RNA polymerase sigma factor (sigma-70 family)